jgi:hypothetical protein
LLPGKLPIIAIRRHLSLRLSDQAGLIIAAQVMPRAGASAAISRIGGAQKVRVVLPHRAAASITARADYPILRTFVLLAGPVSPTGCACVRGRRHKRAKSDDSARIYIGPYR